MGYCRVCDYCGANLDPGEVCDCVEARTKLLMPPIQKTPPPHAKDRRGHKNFSAPSRVGGCGIICEKM